MNLWTLYRRRKLAYELLAEYDREGEIDYATAMETIQAFRATGDWRDGYSAWREATEAKMEKYPRA